MKLHHAFVGLVVLVSLSACYPRQKRSDWRSPARRTTCSSDEECPGGSCVLELGASQGTCNPTGPGLPGLPGGNGGGGAGEGDGGAPSAPMIQPSPDDIHL